jgi:hypothetical protein
MVKEVRIPEDLWLFVGRELRSRGYITEDVFTWAMVEEPRMKWLLLEKEEWRNYRSRLDLTDLNPIEHAKETPQELIETEVVHLIFPKETLKSYPETEKMLKEAGFIEFDYVALMSAEKTEEAFVKRDKFYLRETGKACYYTAHGYRLAMLIHELIHAYEVRLGTPIITDSYTEEALQDEIFYRYLSKHLIHPNNFKLLFNRRTS